MERIKKIEEIKLSTGYVLLKIKLRSSVIITPESGNGPQVDYAEVISVGPIMPDSILVANANPGDIVLDFKSAETFTWHSEKYAIVPRMNIRFLIDPSNFTHGKTARGKTPDKSLN